MVVAGLLTVLAFGYIIYKLSDNLVDYLGVFGMALTHFQVAAMMTTFKLKLPGKFLEVMQWCKSLFGAMIFDFLFTPECQGDYSFYQIWATVTFLPFVCVVIILGLGYVGLIKWYLSQRMANLAFIVLYIMELEQSWKMWDCIELKNGKNVLEHDPSVECFKGTEWWGYASAAMFMGILVTLWPIWAFYYLKNNGRTAVKSKQLLGHIYLKFKEDKWWWEIHCEMGKKWLLVMWEVFIPDGRWQFGLCIATLIVFWLLHTRHQPYKDEWHTDSEIENKLQDYLYALEVILLSLMLVVSEVAGDEDDDAWSIWTISLLAIYFLAVVVIYWKLYKVIKRSRAANKIGAVLTPEQGSVELKALPETAPSSPQKEGQAPVYTADSAKIVPAEAVEVRAVQKVSLATMDPGYIQLSRTLSL